MSPRAALILLIQMYARSVFYIVRYCSAIFTANWNAIVQPMGIYGRFAAIIREARISGDVMRGFDLEKVIRAASQSRLRERVKPL